MKVSVIMAAYDTEKYVRRALRSLFAQTLPKSQYEVIAVSDGGKDGTGQALWEAEQLYSPDLQIRTVRLAANIGVGGACNEAFKLARGQYVVRVDSDDWISERFLELECLFLDVNKEFDGVSCDYYRVDDFERVLCQRNSDEFPIDCGVMVRTLKLKRYSDPRIDNCEMFAGLRILRIALPLYRYRMREGSLTWSPSQIVASSLPK